jgi:hypothetical protein
MPFVLAVKETILPLLLLVFGPVLVLPLTIFLAFVQLLRCIVLVSLRCLLPLLAGFLVFYVEDLLIWPLLCLLLVLIYVAPLRILAAPLVLFPI